MGRSDSLELERRARRRSPGRILLVTLIVVAAGVLAWRVAVFAMLGWHFGSGFDERRFDKLEQRIEPRQAAFARADARMRQLAAAHPDAEVITWIQPRVCVREAGRPEECEPTTPRDQATYDALWGTDVILYQSHDKGRVFFRFYGNDPPIYTLMHAPADTDPDSYADTRGFRSTRSLSPGWTLLGPIPDEGEDDRQWQYDD
ncbi:hypothetical protein ACFV9W_24255 [Streptomyces sp. NPDC059897]|uniref:hypothetical protein n=1 Tax=Streptomyces sp. NPDC059897 TaxID=3346994 RepID=UPI00365CFB65